jgi:hypothetical protein
VGPVFDGIADEASREEALAVLEQLDQSGEMPANIVMTLSMLLNDVDRAMRIGRAMVSRDSVFELEIIFTDEFRAFRQHPEFFAFVEEVGLADYWASAGCRYSNDRVDCGG